MVSSFPCLCRPPTWNPAWKFVFLVGLLMAPDLVDASTPCFKELGGKTQVHGSCGDPFTVMVPKPHVKFALSYPSGAGTQTFSQMFNLVVGGCTTSMKLESTASGGIAFTIEGTAMNLPVSAVIDATAVTFTDSKNQEKSSSCSGIDFKPHGANWTLDMSIESTNYAKLGKLLLVVDATHAVPTPPLVPIWGWILMSAVLAIILSIGSSIIWKFLDSREKKKRAKYGPFKKAAIADASEQPIDIGDQTKRTPQRRLVEGQSDVFPELKGGQPIVGDHLDEKQKADQPKDKPPTDLMVKPKDGLGNVNKSVQPEGGDQQVKEQKSLEEVTAKSGEHQNGPPVQVVRKKAEGPDSKGNLVKPAPGNATIDELNFEELLSDFGFLLQFPAFQRYLKDGRKFRELVQPEMVVRETTNTELRLLSVVVTETEAQRKERLLQLTAEKFVKTRTQKTVELVKHSKTADVEVPEDPLFKYNTIRILSFMKPWTCRLALYFPLDAKRVGNRCQSAARELDAEMQKSELDSAALVWLQDSFDRVKAVGDMCNDVLAAQSGSRNPTLPWSFRQIIQLGYLSRQERMAALWWDPLGKSQIDELVCYHRSLKSWLKTLDRQFKSTTTYRNCLSAADALQDLCVDARYVLVNRTYKDVGWNPRAKGFRKNDAVDDDEKTRDAVKTRKSRKQ